MVSSRRISTDSGAATTLTWKLIRAGFWVAIAAFVLAAAAGLLEDHFGWSDDPRWIAYASGAFLVLASVIAGTVAKLMAALRATPSRFPTGLAIAAIVVGVVTFVVQVITHLGPLGVV